MVEDPKTGGLMERRISDVGQDLARTFSGVLEALPGGPHRPQWLARSLGVNTVLTSRLLKAAQQQDPLAVAHLMPGPEPLRRLLRSAEKKKIDPALIRDARAAVDRFEQLIAGEAGDRSALDAIISGWLPDAREKVELIAKQSVFRGMSQLLGTAADLEHHTFVIYPSAPGSDRADQVVLSATRGLRRVRPGLIVKYDTVQAPGPLFTVDGQPVEDLEGLLLEDFCSRPVPQLRVDRVGGHTNYTLSGDDVGIRSAVTLVHATFLRSSKELRRPPGEGPRQATVAIGVASPTKTLIFDVLLHEDAYPGQQPSLRLYRATPFSAAPGDPAREADRLDVVQTVQPLGRGIARFRAAENPSHPDMLRFVCERRGWDGDLLRGFRCRVEYPLYHSEIVVGFEVGDGG
jgi:hypothetical protein